MYCMRKKGTLCISMNSPFNNISEILIYPIYSQARTLFSDCAGLALVALWLKNKNSTDSPTPTHLSGADENKDVKNSVA